MSAAMADRTPVHLAIRVKVHAGKVPEFDKALTEFVRQSTDFRGVTGVHVRRPTTGPDQREFGIVRSFASDEDRREFYEGELYQSYEATTGPWRDGTPEFRQFDGIEALFLPGAKSPPRWKMALVTWMGVFPASVLWSRTVGAQLTMLHPVAITGVVTLLVVMTVVWCAMPVLTKALRPWLRRGC